MRELHDAVRGRIGISIDPGLFWITPTRICITRTCVRSRWGGIRSAGRRRAASTRKCESGLRFCSRTGNEERSLPSPQKRLASNKNRRLAEQQSNEKWLHRVKEMCKLSGYSENYRGLFGKLDMFARFSESGWRRIAYAPDRRRASSQQGESGAQPRSAVAGMSRSVNRIEKLKFRLWNSRGRASQWWHNGFARRRFSRRGEEERSHEHSRRTDLVALAAG